MIIYQQQKQQVIQLFDQAIAIAQTQQDNNLAKTLKKSQQHLVEEKLYVVICGEFKQGKSSLINAFLDENDLFPVNVDIATNMISTITYGQEEKVSVILGETGKEEIRIINRSEIPQYVTEQKNKGNLKNVKMLMIESSNSQLKEGLVLVDTPGTGSLNIEHTALTYSYIPNADVIIFVSDALSPLKVEELNFIKERIISHCQNLIFVVTKVDAIIEYDTIVKSNREKLSNILQKTPEEICIIPVSSLAKQDYLQYKEDNDLINSHFPELQEKVWSLVKEQRGQILLLKALTDLGRSLIQIKRPLETEYQSYQQRSQEELAKGEKDIKEIQQRLKSFLQDQAEWKTYLKENLKHIEIDIQGQFKDDFVKLQRQSEKYLQDPACLSNPQQIATLLEADIDGMMAKLAKEVNLKASYLYGELEDRTGLNFNPFTDSYIEQKRANFAIEDITIPPKSMVDKAVTMGRTGMFNSGAGAFLGGLFGGIAGGIAGFFGGAGVGAIPGAIAGAHVGAALGGIAGGAKGAVDGIKEISKQDRELAKREIAKILKHYLEDSQRLCTQALIKVINSLRSSIQEELTSQIKRQKESYDKSLDVLTESRKLSQEQVIQRANELKLPLGRISQIQQIVEQLANSVISQSTTTEKPSKPPVTPQSKASPQGQAQEPVTITDEDDNGDFADG